MSFKLPPLPARDIPTPTSVEYFICKPTGWRHQILSKQLCKVQFWKVRGWGGGVIAKHVLSWLKDLKIFIFCLYKIFLMGDEIIDLPYYIWYVTIVVMYPKGVFEVQEVWGYLCINASILNYQYIQVLDDTCEGILWIQLLYNNAHCLLCLCMCTCLHLTPHRVISQWNFWITSTVISP